MNTNQQNTTTMNTNENKLPNIYGIVLNGVHIDVSKSLHGAKCFATRNSYDTITIRCNGGYIAREIAYKNQRGKWVKIPEGQFRYR